MNIAICDDNVYISSRVEGLVDRAFSGNASGYECELFDSGDSLLGYLDKHPLYFQLYLLDIEMAGTNGLDTAAAIRQQDPDAVIIFLTSHGELMPEAFGVQAFHYVVKPFDDEKTLGILLAAIRHLQSRRALYQYVARKKTYTLYRSQIEYIESIGRKVVLHTTDGETQEYYGTLKEAAQKAQGIPFARAHNAYIVNMDYVASMDGQGVVMRCGTTLAVSGKYRDAFHAAWRNFILMRSQ